ncbi:MAG: ABC transporter ATP-binding protein [Desulfitobacteriaceae bacterium]
MTLVAEKLNVTYGDIQVLWDVSLRVTPGEIVALVGSNGAGKTTLLRTISGLHTPLSGSIRLNDQIITGENPAKRVAIGLAHVPEGRQLFSGMTVRENIMAGAYLRRERKEIERDFAWLMDLFPELVKKQKQQAGTLSGGEQQMVAIGRGLMSKPKILFIDELSLGLAPVVVDRLIELIKRIQKELGIGVILVEQDVELAFELADRGYIIETGRIVREGKGSELLSDDSIRQAYLGM